MYVNYLASYDDGLGKSKFKKLTKPVSKITKKIVTAHKIVAASAASAVGVKKPVQKALKLTDKQMKLVNKLGKAQKIVGAGLVGGALVKGAPAAKGLVSKFSMFKKLRKPSETPEEPEQTSSSTNDAVDTSKSSSDISNPPTTTGQEVTEASTGYWGFNKRTLYVFLMTGAVFGLYFHSRKNK